MMPYSEQELKTLATFQFNRRVQLMREWKASLELELERLDKQVAYVALEILKLSTAIKELEKQTELTREPKNG